MKLLDWLRRLGIFRFGAEASVYHNARERPASLQMEGVFDSKKDVIDLEERKAGQPTPSKTSGNDDARGSVEIEPVQQPN